MFWSSSSSDKPLLDVDDEVSTKRSEVDAAVGVRCCLEGIGVVKAWHDELHNASKQIEIGEESFNIVLFVSETRGSDGQDFQRVFFMDTRF